MGHVEGERSSSQRQSMGQEGDHQVGDKHRDQTVDYSRAKIKDAQSQANQDKVNVVLELGQGENELSVEYG